MGAVGSGFHTGHRASAQLVGRGDFCWWRREREGKGQDCEPRPGDFPRRPGCLDAGVSRLAQVCSLRVGKAGVWPRHHLSLLLS